jgi:tRNA-dihydrouridine synthase 1
LSNPALFVPPDHPHVHPSVVTLATRYLDIVETLKTPTASHAIKAHLFRMFKPVLDADESLRVMIAKCHYDPEHGGFDSFREVVRAVEERLKVIIFPDLRHFGLISDSPK